MVGQWELIPVPREENRSVDVIEKAAATYNTMYWSFQMKEKRLIPTLDETESLLVTEIDPWMKSLVAYLADGILPEARAKAAKLVRILSAYSLIEGTLYRTSATHPWSRCVSIEEGNYVLRELHEGNCGAHERAVTLSRKAMLQGFYWPT
ncbi:uncharacterized protein LOC126669537 [Mercurialis annua]|uniref:uncharacterized protein LOC126669537 n=1 Tax=Mercurialis annua TaxID=3986 RepID=UPI00215FD6A3|nr:uncharacterized protein LOC126669537 [Mercurialis annua]